MRRPAAQPAYLDARDKRRPSRAQDNGKPIFSENVQLDDKAYYTAKMNQRTQHDKSYDTSDFAMFGESTRQIQRQNLGNNVKKTSASTARQDATRTRTKTRKEPPRKTVSSIFRKRRRIAAGLIFLLVLSVGVVISANLFLNIESFSLSGECIYSLEEITEIFGSEVGGPIFGFGSLAEEEKILEALPYIQDIKIRRRLPGGVVFEVTPASENYYVAYNEQFAILSQTQKVLRFTQEPEPGLVEIRGVEAETIKVGKNCVFTDKRLQEVLTEMLVLLQDVSPQHITVLDVSDVNSIGFVWENRITVKLGGRAEIEKKIKYALTLLVDTEQSGIGEFDTGTLDLSEYPEKPNVLMY